MILQLDTKYGMTYPSTLCWAAVLCFACLVFILLDKICPIPFWVIWFESIPPLYRILMTLWNLHGYILYTLKRESSSSLLNYIYLRFYWTLNKKSKLIHNLWRVLQTWAYAINWQVFAMVYFMDCFITLRG